jgi:hypothetical protein
MEIVMAVMDLGIWEYGKISVKYLRNPVGVVAER